MADIDANYFTCTLGQAAQRKGARSFKTLVELVDAQARLAPTRPALGFASTCKSSPCSLPPPSHTQH